MYRFLFTFIMFSMIFAADVVFANSIDYLNNQSSDYFRTFNRNAAIDAVDIAHYNPAGTVFMDKGNHVKFDLQYLEKDYGMKYNGTDYHSTAPVYIPSFFMASVRDGWSLYCSLNAIAGGGTLLYEKGLPLMAVNPAIAQNDFKGTSVYGALTSGGAYKLKNDLSFSLAARGVYAYKKYESEGPFAQLDSKNTAAGAGAVAGIDYFPVKMLNLAAKFETPVRLKFERETKSTFGGMFPDGEKKREDLPGVFALGINLFPTDSLSVGTSLTVYLNRTGKNETYDEKGYDNGFDLGFGVDYTINSMVLIGCGFQYAKTGGADKSDYFSYPLDSRCYAVGMKFSPIENFKIGFSSTYIYYLSEKGVVGVILPDTPVEGTFHKRILSFNIGLEYNFI